MKNNSKIGAVFALVALSFCGVDAAMPGFEIEVDTTEPATASALDKKISASLAKLGKKSAISSHLDILNSILAYVGAQAVSSTSQISYCNAVKTLDIYARRFASPGRTPSISKAGIKEIDKFLKNLQDSPLLHSGTVSYISNAITFWDNTAKNYGLTPYQKAVKRQRDLKSKRK